MQENPRVPANECASVFLQVPPRRLPYGQTKDNYTVNTVGVGTAATASINDVRAGWTAGGGIEGAFGGGWSAKVEYLYIDLGKLEQTVTIPPAALAATFNSRLTDNIVRVGLNYKWGGY